MLFFVDDPTTSSYNFEKEEFVQVPEPLIALMNSSELLINLDEDELFSVRYDNINIADVWIGEKQLATEFHPVCDSQLPERFGE